jgi:hypothetical protein
MREAIEQGINLNSQGPISAEDRIVGRGAIGDAAGAEPDALAPFLLSAERYRVIRLE